MRQRQFVSLLGGAALTPLTTLPAYADPPDGCGVPVARDDGWPVASVNDDKLKAPPCGAAQIMMRPSVGFGRSSLTSCAPKVASPGVMMLSSRLEPGRVPLGISATRRPGRVVTICTAKRRMLNTGETHADE